MEKVEYKLFRSMPNTGIDNLQSDINAWLKQKQSTKIVSVCQSEGGVGETRWITISIFYEPKPSEPQLH